MANLESTSSYDIIDDICHDKNKCGSSKNPNRIERNPKTALSVPNSVTHTTRSSPVLSRSKSTNLLQDFLLVWLDASMEQKQTDSHNICMKLQKIVGKLEKFIDVDSCMKYLNKINDEKIFLIVSASLGQKIMSQVNDMVQIDSIFIFCHKIDEHKEWTKSWPKIAGIYSSPTYMYNHLRRLTRDHDHNAIRMSFLPKLIKPETASYKRNLHHWTVSYMYSLVFKQIILNTDCNDAKSRNNLVSYCCQQNMLLESQLKDFKDSYEQKTPIWWYSHDSLIHSMLNHVIKLFDIKMMMKMSFFIRSLYQQLNYLYDEQSAKYTTNVIAYRGQGFTQQEFRNLFDAKDGLILFTGFLLASKEKHVAIDYANRAMHKNKISMGVIFIISINLRKISTLTTPFALIEDYSVNSKEKEILFTMHNVFRVGEIRKTDDNDKLWEVELKFIDDNDPQLIPISNLMSEQINGTGWYRMGQLMLSLGDFKQAEELYNDLLENSSNDIDRALVLNALAKTNVDKGEFNEAALHWEECLKLRQNNLHKNHPDLADAHTNLAQVRHKLGEYYEAIEHFERALKIQLKVIPPNDSDLIACYDNLSHMCNHMRNGAKALKFAEKANVIREKILPHNHPDLASSYYNIGLKYNSMNDHEKALELFNKALQIRQMILPPNHLDLALSYSSVGLVYNDRHEHVKALQFAEKAHKIRENILDPCNRDLANSFYNIGLAYDNLKNYAKAIEFYKKSLEINEINLPMNHPELTLFYSNISLAYNNMREYSNAIDYAEKAHEIRKKILPSHHLDLASSYHYIGCLYESLGENSKAQNCYKRAAHIVGHTLVPNHPFVKLYKK